MARRTRYVMLMASLPAMPALFEAKRTPLSDWKLDERLRWLREDDAALLEAIRALLVWSHLEQEVSDETFMARYHSLLERLDGDLARCVRERVELRTIVAALRRRRGGDGPPAAGEEWGDGPWLARVRAHWRDPDFGVGHLYPWLPGAVEAASAGDALALERIVLGEAWRLLELVDFGHAFDFEAVAFYVLRWHLVARWCSYGAEAAGARFAGLVEAAGERGRPLVEEALG